MTTEEQKSRKLYLVATIAFVIAAASFLIAAIDRMNPILILLVFADSVLALIFLWKYCHTKE